MKKNVLICKRYCRISSYSGSTLSMCKSSRVMRDTDNPQENAPIEWISTKLRESVRHQPERNILICNNVYVVLCHSEPYVPLSFHASPLRELQSQFNNYKTTKSFLDQLKKDDLRLIQSFFLNQIEQVDCKTVDCFPIYLEQIYPEMIASSQSRRHDEANNYCCAVPAPPTHDPFWADFELDDSSNQECTSFSIKTHHLADSKSILHDQNNLEPYGEVIRLLQDEWDMVYDCILEEENFLSKLSDSRNHSSLLSSTSDAKEESIRSSAEELIILYNSAGDHCYARVSQETNEVEYAERENCLDIWSQVDIEESCPILPHVETEEEEEDYGNKSIWPLVNPKKKYAAIFSYESEEENEKNETIWRFVNPAEVCLVHSYPVKTEVNGNNILNHMGVKQKYPALTYPAESAEQDKENVADGQELVDIKQEHPSAFHPLEETEIETNTENVIEVWELDDPMQLCPSLSAKLRRNTRQTADKRLHSVNTDTNSNVQVKNTKRSPSPKKTKTVLKNVNYNLVIPRKTARTPSFKKSKTRVSNRVFTSLPGKLKSFSTRKVGKSSIATVQYRGRRFDHNKMEQRRRNEQRELYDELRKTIPAEYLKGKKGTKQNILLVAEKYVKMLQKDEKVVKESIQKLFNENKQLKNLKKVLQATGGK